MTWLLKYLTIIWKAYVELQTVTYWRLTSAITVWGAPLTCSPVKVVKMIKQTNNIFKSSGNDSKDEQQSSIYSRKFSKKFESLWYVNQDHLLHSSPHKAETPLQTAAAKQRASLPHQLLVREAFIPRRSRTSVFLIVPLLSVTAATFQVSGNER